MLTILFVLHHLEAGGLERVILNIVRNLDRKSFRPLLLLRDRRGAFLSSLPQDVQVFDLGGRRLRWSIPAIARIIRSTRSDIVLAGSTSTNLAIVAAAKMLRKRPAIIVSEHIPLNSQDHGVLKRKAMKWAYRSATRVVTPLRELAEQLCAEFDLDSNRVVVQPNPVYEQEQLAEVELRPLDPPLRGRTVVAAGRLVQMKRFDHLLRAFALLKGDPADVSLVVLGEGPERRALEALAEELQISHRVSFPGRVADPLAWFRAASMVALSSEREGFGNVLVEAMACGTPVVSFDCPHGPRFILENGEAGLLVPAGDIQALTDGIHRLLVDAALVQRLRTRGIERAQAFEASRAVLGYEELFAAAHSLHRAPR